MSNASEKKRYVLFSKEDGRPDSEKPCAFFASAQGCRNGAKCKFLHGAAPVVSSTDVDEPVKQKKERKEKKEKRNREEPINVAPPAPMYVPVVPKPVPVQVHAPKPTQAPAPAPIPSAQDKLVLELQQKLEKQQALLEAQMKILQQQQQVQQQQQQSQVTQVKPENKKENKRKQNTSVDNALLSNKSPKTLATPAVVQQVPAVAHGVVLHPVSQKATPKQKSSNETHDLSARASATYHNNVTQSNNESSDDDDSEFLFGAVNHVLSTGLQNSNNSTPYKQPENAAQSPFVRSVEVVKALTTSNSAHALHGSTKKNIFATKAPSAATATVAAPTAATSLPRAPVVPFDPMVVDMNMLPWQQLVSATRANPRFGANYAFSEDSTWVKAKPFGPWCASSNLPSVLSMDCEMCETTDPVTGEKCENALVRFSVIDCTNNGQVLIDALVNPGLPITDARTHIHGITEQQLSSITWTLRHAQAALLNLCSDRTVFVGHSLHKDLRALKFNHTNVVDTAYLFTLENEPGAAPSLRDVSEQILGTKLSDTHDSVEDARASLYAAAVLLVRGPQLPLVRRVGNPSTSGNNNNNGNSSATAPVGSSLLVHRIPDYCTEQHVQEMIVAYTQVMPAKINPITRGAPSNGEANAVPSGKTTIYFASATHCDLAFESIPGPNRPDKQNRDQKRVYFKGGGYICVRK